MATPPPPPFTPAGRQVLSVVERSHWVNGIVGFYAAAFALRETEQLLAAQVVSRILDFLNIPERGEPVALPALVDHEVHGRYYERLLHQEGGQLPIRQPHPTDTFVPPGAWRNAVLEALLTAYPDLDGIEQLGVSRALDQLLEGFGVPDRACYFLPVDTVRAARDS